MIMRVVEYFEKNNLAQRILVSALYFPALLLSTWQPWIFSSFMTLILGFSWFEFLKLRPSAPDEKANSVRLLATILIGTLPIILTIFEQSMFVGFGFGLVVLQILVIQGMRAMKPLDEILKSVARPIFGTLYLTVPIALLVSLLKVDGGQEAVWFLFFVVAGSDTLAYFMGTKFGRRPFFQHISPKKTMEGLWGGILGAVLVSIGFYFALNHPSYSIPPLWMCMVLALFLALSGIFGDLFESLIKRTAGVKDSGRIMAGHGGALDRFDSVLFASIPLFFYIIIRHGFR